MDKKIILFDIDGTLIEPHEITSGVYKQIFEETKISKDEIFKIKEEYKSTLERGSDFSPDDLIDYLSKSLNVEITNNPFLNKIYYKNALYPEVKKTLEELNKNFILGIFSEGLKNYQENKIYLSGLGDFFNEDFIFIGRRKLDDNFLEKLPEGAIIIDDKKEVVEKLKSLNRFKVVWINRNNDEKMDGVATIHNLSELIDLINFKKDW